MEVLGYHSSREKCYSTYPPHTRVSKEGGNRKRPSSIRTSLRTSSISVSVFQGLDNMAGSKDEVAAKATGIISHMNNDHQVRFCMRLRWRCCTDSGSLF